MAQTTLDRRMFGSQVVDEQSHLSDHTITASDILTFSDVGGSNVSKKDTVQGVLDLAGGGAYQFISDTNCTDQSEFAVESLSDTYDTYLFHMTGVKNTSATAYLRMYLGTGTSYASSGYYWARWGVGVGNGGSGASVGQNESSMGPSSQGPTNSTRNYFFHFIRKSNGAERGLLVGTNVGNENATWDESFYHFMGYADTGTVLNSVKMNFVTSTSTISVASCRVYGLVNS